MSQNNSSYGVAVINSRTTAVVVLAVGCLAFLVAHYLLRDWAESSLMAHDIQHLVIFAAGAACGSASYKLLKR